MITLTTLFTSFPILSAQAEGRVFQQISTLDDFNPANVDPGYDLEKIEIGLFDTNLDSLKIWLYFKSPITQGMFYSSSGKTPWALVSLWRAEPTTIGGTSGDFWLYTPFYSQYPLTNSGITATAEGNLIAGEKKTILSSCVASTWSNIGEGAHWIGFTISRKCAHIPDQFWVQGYVDPDTSNPGGAGAGTINDWDYAPSNPMYVDLNSAPTPTLLPTPTPSPTLVGTKLPQEIYFDDIPDADLSKESITFDAYATSGLPVDVMSLTPKVCQVSYDNGDLSDAKSVNFLDSGRCTLSLSQYGNSNWWGATTRYVKFMVTNISGLKAKPTMRPTPKASPSKAAVISGSASTTKKTEASGKTTVTGKIGGSASVSTTTITCVKGKLTKTVKAVKPICPAGYTLKR